MTLPDLRVHMIYLRQETCLTFSFFVEKLQQI